MHPSTTPSRSASATAPAPSLPRTRRVIDAPVRVFHWLFALSFAGAWLSAESERWRGVHLTLGYAFAGLLIFRLLYGLWGPRHARLGLLLQRARALGPWLQQARSGSANLQGLVTWSMSMAMLLLLVLALPIALSGYVADGNGPVQAAVLEDWHEALSEAGLLLVLAHLGVMALLSLLRGRNLALPMLTGRTAGPGPDLVHANRAWLAAVVLACFVGWTVWQLPQDLGRLPVAQGDARAASVEDDDD